MAIRIRLSRGGAKKRPFYRIVVADSRSPRDGRYIEKVGLYNPMLAKDHPDRVTMNTERMQYWLGVGAKPSDRVARFCAQAGLAEARATPTQTKAHLPKAKAMERMKEAEEARKQAEEAAAEAAAAPAEDAPADEAPAEDAPAEEPVAEEPVAEEPVAEEPVAEEPAAEDASAEEQKAG